MATCWEDRLRLHFSCNDTSDGIDEFFYSENTNFCNLVLEFLSKCRKRSSSGELVFPLDFSAKGRQLSYYLSEPLGISCSKGPPFVISFTNGEDGGEKLTERVSFTWISENCLAKIDWNPDIHSSMVVNDVLGEIFTTNQVEGTNGQYFALHSHTAAESGHAMHSIIRNKNYKQTLEIGLAFGISALYFCQAHKDNQMEGHHIAVDCSQSSDWHNVGVNNIKKAGLEQYFTHIDGPDWLVLPKLLEGGKQFDFIYIDGPHSFQGAFLDFFYADKLLTIGGTLYFDDNMMHSVHKVCSFVHQNMKARYRPVEIPSFPYCMAFEKISDVECPGFVEF